MVWLASLCPKGRAMGFYRLAQEERWMVNGGKTIGSESKAVITDKLDRKINNRGDDVFER